MLRPTMISVFVAGAFATSAAADEVNYDAKVRQLGIAVGKAHSCAEAEARPLLRDDSETIYDLILFELGHELAYIFAVGVGYGAASSLEGVDCAKLTAHVNEVKAKMGLGGEN